MPDPSLPASTTPVQDYLDRPAPGATVDHLVVPRSLAQSMPLRWQQVFVGLLADLHDAYAELPWPDYKVVPSRWERLVDLDEEQLQAAGYLTDLDADGHLEYRDTADSPSPTRSDTACSRPSTTPCRGPRTAGSNPAPPPPSETRTVPQAPGSARCRSGCRGDGQATGTAASSRIPWRSPSRCSRAQRSTASSWVKSTTWRWAPSFSSRSRISVVRSPSACAVTPSSSSGQVSPVAARCWASATRSSR